MLNKYKLCAVIASFTLSSYVQAAYSPEPIRTVSRSGGIIPMNVDPCSEVQTYKEMDTLRVFTSLLVTSCETIITSQEKYVRTETVGKGIFKRNKHIYEPIAGSEKTEYRERTDEERFDLSADFGKDFGENAIHTVDVYCNLKRADLDQEQFQRRDEVQCK